MGRKSSKSLKKATGCRKCKFRVSIPKTKDGEREPKCCFGFDIDDKRLPDCDMFIESSYYELHPEEP